MSPKFTIKSGKVTGRGHILSGRNCQDSLKTVSLTIKNETFLIGWISDGCSSGSHNEVGSNLGTEFLINQSELYLQEELPVEIIPLRWFFSMAVSCHDNSCYCCILSDYLLL